MAHESFAKTVLDTLGKLAATSGEATVAELSHALMIQTRPAHKRMLNALSDLKQAGRIVRPRQGVYAPALAKGGKQPELREVMWRVLRMRKRVTVDDLVEMAGASVKYSHDWLQMLDKHEIVRRIPPQTGNVNQQQVWQLIKDTVEMPADTDNAKRLRDLRKKKKQQAMADLLAARELIGKACLAINEMED